MQAVCAFLRVDACEFCSHSDPLHPLAGEGHSPPTLLPSPCFHGRDSREQEGARHALLAGDGERLKRKREPKTQGNGDRTSPENSPPLHMDPFLNLFASPLRASEAKAQREKKASRLGSVAASSRPIYLCAHAYKSRNYPVANCGQTQPTTAQSDHDCARKWRNTHARLRTAGKRDGTLSLQRYLREERARRKALRG